MDRQAVHKDLERVRVTFRQLLDVASDAELHAPSDGTRWTNKQLLFHMLLGFLIMRALMLLLRVFDRLPAKVGRGFARLLNAGTNPFDVVNYVGSCFGGTLSRRRMIVLCDRVIAKLHRRLDAESDADLDRGMHYPTRWDPFFQDFMTLADLYRYPSQHFDFHRKQLTLAPEGPREAAP